MILSNRTSISGYAKVLMLFLSRKLLNDRSYIQNFINPIVIVSVVCEYSHTPNDPDSDGSLRLHAHILPGL